MNSTNMNVVQNFLQEAILNVGFWNFVQQ